MTKSKWIILFVLAPLFFYCAGGRQFTYNQSLPHQIKNIAIQLPDSTTIPPGVPADYLQKMLAYMLFHEKSFYVQPLDTTNLKARKINYAETSPLEMHHFLETDGILRYNFFDYIREDNQVRGFTFSLALLDCKTGCVVWQAVREYRGKQNQKSLQALKLYMQTKVKEKSKMPFFVELYGSLKASIQSLENPSFTDEEIMERLSNTIEPF